MFESLDSADSNAVKVATALLESKNGSVNSESSATINSQLSSESSNHQNSTVENLTSVEKQSSYATNKNKIVEIKSLKAFEDHELYLSNEMNLKNFVSNLRNFLISF